AVVLFAGPAHMTVPATGPARVDRDGVTPSKARHAGSQFFHPPGNLVPEREGQRSGLPVAGRARNGEKIAVAEAGRGDLHNHLTGAGVRLRHVLKLRRRLLLHEPVGEHGVPFLFNDTSAFVVSALPQGSWTVNAVWNRSPASTCFFNFCKSLHVAS